jgi:hypothetical protein
MNIIIKTENTGRKSYYSGYFFYGNGVRGNKIDSHMNYNLFAKGLYLWLIGKNLRTGGLA